MPQLSAKKRAQLRNAAFAYVDSKGRRRLPIHDEAHVRNALARFSQTKFEDDAARERARKRLLTAAKKYGIVPIGFITGQLASERQEGESSGRAGVVRGLPSGQVTFLLSDIEDSTGLLRRLEDGYAKLLDDMRRLLRRAVQRSGGKEVDARADERSRCSSARPVRSRLRWRSSGGSAHDHGRPAPRCGSGSASIPVVPR